MRSIAKAAKNQNKAAFEQSADATISSVGSGLLGKEKLIKTSLGIEASKPAATIEEANKQRGLESSGSLPMQADAVLAALGF